MRGDITLPESKHLEGQLQNRKGKENRMYVEEVAKQSRRRKEETVWQEEDKKMPGWQENNLPERKKILQGRMQENAWKQNLMLEETNVLESGNCRANQKIAGRIPEVV